MYSVAPITVDGVQVGTVTFGYESDVPLDALAPMDDPLSIPGSTGSGLLGHDGSHPAHYDASGPGSGRTEPKVTPHVSAPGNIHTGTYGPSKDREPTVESPHIEKHDVPHESFDTHKKQPRFTLDDIHKAVEGDHPEQKPKDQEPTFRPGRTPLGKDQATTPPKFSVDDVQKAVKGHDTEKLPHYTTDDIKHASITGGIDRSRFKAELEKNPSLYKKMAWMVSGEVMGRATKEARMAQLETAFNRASRRGQSLEHVLKSVSESSQGYYAGHGAPGGGTYSPRKEPTEAEVEQFKNEIVAPVMAGSDYARGMTGNASAGVAARQIAKGTPYYNMNSQGGDILFDEDRGRPPLPRLAGAGAETVAGSEKPIGVTRLGPDSRKGKELMAAVDHPSKPGELPAAPGYKPELDTVDPRLREILGAAGMQFMARNPGYHVGVTSGRRHGATQAQHASEAGAIDLQIRDSSGKALPNFGADTNGLYTELAKIARGEMLARHPDLESRFNWGGYFGADKRPGLANPATGAGRPDLMHYDLGGKAYPGRAGITEAYRKLGVLPGIQYGKAPSQEKTAAE